MVGNPIYIRALKSLGSRRYYSKLYCQNGQHITASSIVPNNLCKLDFENSSSYLLLQPLRYQHQGTDLRGINLKSPDKQNQKVMPEKIVVPPSLTVKEPPSLTVKEKFKKAVKEYGPTVIVFHIAISLMSLGTSYLLVSSGLDIRAIFEYIGLKGLISKSEAATSAGTFAIAFALHKVFAPVRIAITLVCVPFIVRYLRRIGFLKK